MRQNDDFDEDEECSNIELYDMVMDPRLWPPSQQQPRISGTTGTVNGNSQPQPDPEQLAGLHNTLTCCVMPPPFRQNYGQL